MTVSPAMKTHCAASSSTPSARATGCTSFPATEKCASIGAANVHKLDKLYEGVPIYVISTGPSLRGFDFHRLDGRLTIGVNRVIEHYHPSIVHLVDIRAQ